MLSPPSSGKQKQRSILNSCINHLTDLTNINNLRQIQATYDPRQAPETLKLQLLIKSQKSLVLDSENTSRDSHSVSKQLYLWSYEQPDRAIQDVGDRLAYMTYQIGDIQSQFTQNLEKSRSDLKQIRNLENEMIKLRDGEKALQGQIDKAQQDVRIKTAESTERINVLVKEHESIEQRRREMSRQIPIEKRRLMKLSYRTQFQAHQELADKLSIISNSGQRLLDELNDDPSVEYHGKDRTANIKGHVANSLAHYKAPCFASASSEAGWTNNLEPQPGPFELHRTDTRMFGETHPHVLTTSTDGVDTINTRVGGDTVSVQASQTTDVSKVTDNKEANISLNVASESPSKKTGGSGQPPKLPDRPKVHPQAKSNQFNNNSSLDDMNKSSNDETDKAPNTCDFPPAYTPNQSENT